MKKVCVLFTFLANENCALEEIIFLCHQCGPDEPVIYVSFFAASCSLGAAQASVEQALDHLRVRKQFGSPLADFQVGVLLSLSWSFFAVVPASFHLNFLT